ncbi:nuclease-related domain-containing protein [Priestia megaterium]|uniref:nuclease-related domain-containing protein n=1 Tax=Priestia megaterium TaxID=1404 RepID=UPI00159BC5F0|nr:nuclease-related domain-containing protein [Priestia megaterium]
MSKIEEQKIAKEMIAEVFTGLSGKFQDYYEEQLIRWLSSHTILVHNGKGIYARKPFFLEPYNLISKHIDKLGLKNTKYNGRPEITEVCSKILDSLIKEFEQLIKPNPIGYLVCILTYLDRNVLATFATMTWFHSMFRDGTEEKNEKYELGVVISDTFSYMIDQEDKKFKDVFKGWESHLGLDKISFEMTLEIILDSLEGTESSSKEVDNVKALEYARAIGDIIQSRDNVNNKIFVSQSLSITENGTIEVDRIEDFEEKYNEFQRVNLHWLANKSEQRNISEDNLFRINQVCEEHFGLKSEEFIEFAEELLNFYNSTTWIISTQEKFPTTIKKFFNKDEVILKDFLSHLIRKPNEDNDYLSVSKRIARPLRKSLILYYKDWFICPCSVLYYSLLGLYNDVFDRNLDLDNTKLSAQLQKIYQDIDDDFEKDITAQLEAEFKTPVKHDTHKIYINDRDFITPPGQIDILFFHDSTLFVIECKNFPFKYNTQAIGNEVNKTKTAFTYKLKDKIEFVEQNIDAVANLLELNRDDIEKVNGIFITNNFSFAQVVGEVEYPVINNTQVIEWFNKYNIQLL